ncbi:protein of unknown function [Maridesulfovibrio hydrothermalis AM13 = DSM 14728]|uniref:Uncharacterized protein n=1 Tax=Maridesulfovibrio hydrothermalis AM13 = DSM 14728 TaxID=1121451 RepID=L0RFZ8_9BACT|nr:protein of unknown function [Maridesulfovibrio hydrothermalis AM13 = DSM 14728]
MSILNTTRDNKIILEVSYREFTPPPFPNLYLGIRTMRRYIL